MSVCFTAAGADQSGSVCALRIGHGESVSVCDHPLAGEILCNSQGCSERSGYLVRNYFNSWLTRTATQGHNVWQVLQFLCVTKLILCR